MVRLESLHEGIRRCTACPLACSREHAVPGAGPAPAVVMFVGEAPGREEDKVGLPFVGRSGKFLDWLLSAIGRSRAEFFITSAVKCRPPGNRRPEPCEFQTCRELWLKRQIELITPKLVVCLGGVSTQSLLGKVDLQAVHGTVIEQGGQRFFVTYHPSAGMRFPRVREAMLADFIVLRELLASFES
jgi:uracil-DNA glycosylase family 4